MAFADPQSVTVNAVAHSLARVGISDARGVFRKDDGTFELQVTQTGGKRARRAIRLTHRKVEPDVLNPALNVPVEASVTLVIDVPTTGFSLAEQGDVGEALLGFLSASSYSKLTQLLGGEL